MLTIENEEETLRDMPEGRTYRVLLTGEENPLRLSARDFPPAPELTVTAAADRENGLRLLEQEKFDSIVFELRADAEKSLLFRREVRLRDEKIPILFVMPFSCWSDGKFLGRLSEDPRSYCIPENADRNFMTGKLRQIIGSCRAENSIDYLKNKITRNWQLAGFLQRAMLPPWVYFSKSYEFSSYYRPFSQVSGDLFEWLPLDEDRAVFIFGDISGHGTHSALAMTAVQTFLKQTILPDRKKAEQPAQIAAELNEFFCHHLHNIVYMSTLIAYFDFRNNFLRYQNAGYMDLLCFHARTGQQEIINPEKKGNLPPGMLRDAVYTGDDDVEYHFADSDVFLCCSDGLLSLSKDRDGRSRMDEKTCLELTADLVADTRQEENSVAIPFRCSHMLRQIGYRHTQDDLAMVLIRKTMPSEREYTFSCRVPADKNAVDDICLRAAGFVSKHYDDMEISVNTELLLEEYLINVILHGFDEYEKLNEYIAVKLCAFERELKLIIWDHGREWDGFITQSNQADEKLERLNECMAPSGRGLPIIRKIASRISRQRFSGLNESIFIIPLRDPGEEPCGHIEREREI